MNMQLALLPIIASLFIYSVTTVAAAAVLQTMLKCHDLDLSSLVGFWPADGYNHNYYGKFKREPTCAINKDGKVKPANCVYDRQEKALNLKGKITEPVVRIETEDFNFDETGSFTIVMRIKPKTLDTLTQPLVVKGNWEWDFGVWLSKDKLFTGSHNNNHLWDNRLYRIRENQWHHIAYTYNDGTAKMYVNGRDVGVTKSYRINENGMGGGLLLFGARGDILSETFKGLMTEVAIFDEALPQDKIHSIAINGFCNGLRAWLDDADGPVSTQEIVEVNVRAHKLDHESNIEKTYFRINDSDKVALKRTDLGSDEYPHYSAKTEKPLGEVGLHDICVWAEDNYDRKSEKRCSFIPVYDPAEGYIVSSGEILGENLFFTEDLELEWPWVLSFVVKYKVNKEVGNPRAKSALVFKAGDHFEVRSTKFWSRTVKKEVGKVFFQGQCTINGGKAPSGDYYRFKVWATDSGDWKNGEDYPAKLRLKLYWKEPERQMEVVVFDNQAAQQFYGQVHIHPGIMAAPPPTAAPTSIMTVDYTASLSSFTEPGSRMTFMLTVKNTDKEYPITLNTVVDGTLQFPDALCAPVPRQIHSRGEYRCSFEVEWSSGRKAPYGLTFPLIASGKDKEGNPISGTDVITISVEPSSLPDSLDPSITVDYSVSPTRITEPGGTVKCTVVVKNTSSNADPVKFTEITGKVVGRAEVTATDLVCDPHPRSGLGSGAKMTCSFEVEMSTRGKAPYTESFTVSVIGSDDEGMPVSGTSDATVTVETNPKISRDSTNLLLSYSFPKGIYIPIESPYQETIRTKKIVFPLLDDCSVRAGYQICVGLSYGFEDKTLAGYIANAKARWESIIIEDISDINRSVPSKGIPTSCNNIPSTIDDLFICVSISDSDYDGPGRVLGYAISEWYANRSPHFSEIVFDSADVPSLGAELEMVALHEIGHAVGIGTTWIPDVVAETSKGSGVFDYKGTNGIRVWQTDWGCPGKPKIEDRDAPNGIEGGDHFDELCLGLEMMTPKYIRGDPAPPISSLSIAALADMGYQVDWTKADSFTVPEACCSKAPATPPAPAAPLAKLSATGSTAAVAFGTGVLAEYRTNRDTDLETRQSVEVIYMENDVIYGVQVTD